MFPNICSQVYRPVVAWDFRPTPPTFPWINLHIHAPLVVEQADGVQVLIFGDLKSIEDCRRRVLVHRVNPDAKGQLTDIALCDEKSCLPRLIGGKFKEGLVSLPVYVSLSVSRCSRRLGLSCNCKNSNKSCDAQRSSKMEHGPAIVFSRGASLHLDDLRPPVSNPCSPQHVPSMELKSLLISRRLTREPVASRRGRPLLISCLIRSRRHDYCWKCRDMDE